MDIRDEFPTICADLATWSRDCSLNDFGVIASRPLSEWQEKGWIYSDMRPGWFQWYCRYYVIRRLPQESQGQIKHWNRSSATSRRCQ
jgi:hypothetical protein